MGVGSGECLENPRAFVYLWGVGSGECLENPGVVMYLWGVDPGRCCEVPRACVPVGGWIWEISAQGLIPTDSTDSYKFLIDSL